MIVDGGPANCSDRADLPGRGPGAAASVRAAVRELCVRCRGTVRHRASRRVLGDSIARSAPTAPDCRLRLAICGPASARSGGAFGADLPEARKVLGFHLGRRPVLAADGVVHFLAVDADLLGGVDPQTHLVAADVHHGDLDVVPDHDRLVPLTGQHQHAGSFLGKGPENVRPVGGRGLARPLRDFRVADCPLSRVGRRWSRRSRRRPSVPSGQRRIDTVAILGRLGQRHLRLEPAAAAGASSTSSRSARPAAPGGSRR